MAWLDVLLVWSRRIAWSVILIVFVGFGLYVFAVFNWSYSEGERAGYLQKFSTKGWLCKTHEGEIAMTTVPGVAPLIWSFSVWDNAMAEQISGHLGKKVVVHYREYRGLPTECFGTTDYFVDSVKPAE